MERMSNEDSEAIMSVLNQALFAIMQQAAERLPFPIKVTSTCKKGFIMALSVAYPGAEPVVTPLREEVAMVTFPITVTCISVQTGAKLTATIPHPERVTEGNA